MNIIARTLQMDLLIATNDVTVTAEAHEGTHVAPYRGKMNRNAILAFLESAGKKARAIVYSHDDRTGPVGVDIASGQHTAWVSANE
jgi:hypothetical protein